MQTYNETEVLQVLSDALCKGAFERIGSESDAQAKMGILETSALLAILKRQGIILEIDAQRVTSILDQDGKI